LLESPYVTPNTNAVADTVFGSVTRAILDAAAITPLKIPTAVDHNKISPGGELPIF
jgi:hypothetical protein